MDKLYRPSNGTEGDIFMAKFCEKCAKYNDGGCGILFHSMAFSEREPEYPREWIYEDPKDVFSGKCTAFEPAGNTR